MSCVVDLDQRIREAPPSSPTGDGVRCLSARWFGRSSYNIKPSEMIPDGDTIFLFFSEQRSITAVRMVPVPEDDGTLRSTVFPGLWLDPSALVEEDFDRLLEVLQSGLDSPEHAEFVARLREKAAKQKLIDVRPVAA